MNELSQKTQQRMTSIPKKNVIPKFEDKLAKGMKILELLQIYEDLTICRDRSDSEEAVR